MGRYDDDYDEDIKPRAAKRYDDDVEEATEDETPRSTIRRGWGAAESVKTSTSDFAQRLKIGDDPVIIKFLEDDPFASYRQHWVERQGQKSFVCIADMDERGCPLCEVGNRPSTRFSFNVALLSYDDEPTIKAYEVGPRVIDQLKNFHTDPRQGPLSKNYWAVSRTGKGSSSATNHQMVKERDLNEEWSVAPLSERDLVAIQKKCYTPDIISVPKYKTLQDVAAEE
jgi:hypothetical protein